MIVRKTLEQAKAVGGRFDRAKFESFTDADPPRQIVIKAWSLARTSCAVSGGTAAPA